jgi:hypothetical protein
VIITGYKTAAGTAVLTSFSLRCSRKFTKFGSKTVEPGNENLTKWQKYIFDEIFCEIFVISYYIFSGV